MKIYELWDKIEKFCPSTLAEEWDNSGYQISYDENDVTSVLVALEITFDVIAEAKTVGANVIVTHHPLYFGGTAYITPEYTIGKYTGELTSSGISVFSAHTSFDKLTGGNNDYFGELLGAKDIALPHAEEDIYRLGTVPETTVGDFIDKLVSVFDLNPAFIHLVGEKNKKVSRIGWCTGAGFEFVYPAVENGAELFITGDLKYHDARDASERGIPVIDIGHFGSEKIFTENMYNMLVKSLKGEINVIKATRDADPFAWL